MEYSSIRCSLSSRICEWINRIPLAHTEFHTIEDKLIWVHHSSGKFSVKSAYAAITMSANSQLSHGQPDIWKKLWKLKIQDRLKFFCWRILNNIIPTKLMLIRFLPLNDDQSSCPIYSMEEETQKHPFLKCTFMRILWRHSLWPLNISCFADTEISHWLECILHPSKRLNIPSRGEHHFQLFAILAMDNMWFLRNKTIHESFIPNIENCVWDSKNL